MKRLIAAALVFLASMPIFAQEEGFPNLKPKGIPRMAKVVEFRAPEQSGAKKTAELEEIMHVRYCNRDDYPLYMNIFRPKGEKGLLPCLMFMPGSAWLKQNIDAAGFFARSMAARGYVVAMVEYRPCDFALFPAPVEDSKTAVRFLRKNARKYGIDTENIFIGGSSSGGHVTEMHAYTQDSDLFDTPLYGKYSCKANALVDFFGPTEMVQLFNVFDGFGPEDDHHLGGLTLGNPLEEKAEFARVASPIYYVHPGIPPTFIAQGDCDGTVPYQQSHWLAQAMENAGATYEFYRVIGADHGGPAFDSEEMFDLVDAFLKKYMK